MSVAVMRLRIQWDAAAIVPADDRRCRSAGVGIPMVATGIADVAPIDDRLRRKGAGDFRSTLRTAAKAGAEIIPATVADLPDRRRPIVRPHIEIMGADPESNAGHHTDK